MIRLKIVLSSAVTVLCLLCLPVSARDELKGVVEELESTNKPEATEGVIELFDGPKKFQNDLAEEGFFLEFNHTNDFAMNFNGLLSKNSAPKAMSLFDMNLTFDTETMGLWKGGTAFIQAQSIYGKGLTESRLGDLQTISNIDADERIQLSEFWYEQRIFSDKFRLAAGKTDANGEFAIFEEAENFIGSSFTLIPNIPMPTYPEQAIGTWMEYNPVDWYSIKAGIYDGGGRGDDLGFRTAFEGKGGYVTLVQTGIMPVINNYEGNYHVGFWSHSADLETIAVDDPGLMSSNNGFYAQFVQKVYKEKNSSTQGISVMGQFGWAPSDRNEIARYYGASLLYTGLIPERNFDVTGLGLALADLSHRYKKAEGLQNEAAIELFYKLQLNDYVAIQPDVQIILNTGGSRKTSFALGLRSIISLAPRESL